MTVVTEVRRQVHRGVQELNSIQIRIRRSKDVMPMAMEQR